MTAANHVLRGEPWIGGQQDFLILVELADDVIGPVLMRITVAAKKPEPRVRGSDAMILPFHLGSVMFLTLVISPSFTWSAVTHTDCETLTVNA